jgi:hypothetical protein
MVTMKKQVEKFKTPTAYIAHVGLPRSTICLRSVHRWLNKEAELEEADDEPE